MKVRSIIAVSLIAALLAARSAAAQFIDATGPSSFKTYQSRYYIIRTDLPPEQVREVVLHMSKMAEEYHARTAGFSGQINERLPFLLFSKMSDYLAASGMQGSAGVFTGERLMAVTDEKLTARTWHVIQHEGFHQFAHAVIRGEIPAWANEGLAEYFGEGVWTGDGFVTGLIPASRLKEVREEFNTAGTFKPIPDMMMLSYQSWNSKLTMANYDQGWSMTQFLAHGEDGKYQTAFTGFMRDIGRGKQWATAWRDNFGDAVGFEQHWRDYWSRLPDNPTLVGYLNATTATLTSFVGRAFEQKQTFSDFAALKSAVDAGQLKMTDADWLPMSLAKQAISLSSRVGTWSIEPAANKQPSVVCIAADGTRLIGTFKLRGGHVESTSVEIDYLAQTLVKAKELFAAGKKAAARDLLQAGIHQHPTSGAVADAQKYFATLK